MVRLMDIGLERLKNIVVEMGDYSAKTVFLAIDSYINDQDLMEQLYISAQEIRKMQEEVSELAVEIIARYQPVASDLRFLKSCIDIAYGFSRFGRYAFDIAQVLRIFGKLTECDKKAVDDAGKHVKEMIKTSIEAFTEKNVEKAKKVKEMDVFIDKIYLNSLKRAAQVKENGIKCIVSEVLILRYLERIADHATYIADSTIYIVTGERTPKYTL
ncbi:MAG: phosphate uptake regulator PhoU [Nitrososphaeria archaeon]|nr:phosphate uptake regulator PhoU [Nitrososphaeria archaeon]